MTTYIKQVAKDSPQARQLLVLLNSEWPDLKEFEDQKLGLAVPDPLVVVCGADIVGGASFTIFSSPLEQNLPAACWINALYIKPPMRRRGLASKVIKAAQKLAHPLFALTDLPQLYEREAWKTIKTDKSGSVMMAQAGV